MSTKTIEIYKPTMNRSLKGYLPSGMTQLASITGGQINQNFKSKYDINVVRLFFQAIAGGVGAAGTSSCLNYLAQRVRIWKGPNDGGVLVADLDNTSLIQAHHASVMRMAPADQNAALPNLVDPAIAAAGTYNAWVDIAINLKAGEYFIQVDFPAVAGMAVYIPATLTFGFTLAAINFGYDVKEPEVMKSGAKVVTNGFSISGIKEAYIEAVAAGLAAIVNVYEFDETQLNNFGIQSCSSFVTDKIAALATPASGLYKSSQSMSSLRVELGTATTMFYVVYTY